MVNYFTIPPPRQLTDYIRFFWVLESDARNGEPYIHRSMADGCPELLFHYEGVFDQIDGNQSQPSFTSGIHSQSSNHKTFSINQKFGIFGVYLYPYAVRRFFRLSPGELTDEMPDLHTAIGREGKMLEEQIMVAPDNTSRYEMLTSFFERKLRQNSEIPHRVQSAVRHVIQTSDLPKVRDLAYQFHLSERQFERKFKEYSGLTPKTYLRILRFANACSYYGKTLTTLKDIAFQCGYYDQSHFIKDFKAFSGYHPSEYFGKNAEGIEWRLNAV